MNETPMKTQLMERLPHPILFPAIPCSCIKTRFYGGGVESGGLGEGRANVFSYFSVSPLRANGSVFGANTRRQKGVSIGSRRSHIRCKLLAKCAISSCLQPLAASGLIHHAPCHSTLSTKLPTLVRLFFIATMHRVAPSICRDGLEICGDARNRGKKTCYSPTPGSLYISRAFLKVQSCDPITWHVSESSHKCSWH